MACRSCMSVETLIEWSSISHVEELLDHLHGVAVDIESIGWSIQHEVYGELRKLYYPIWEEVGVVQHVVFPNNDRHRAVCDAVHKTLRWSSAFFIEQHTESELSKGFFSRLESALVSEEIP